MSFYIDSCNFFLLCICVVDVCVCVPVCIFPATLPPGMQRASSEGGASANHRPSFLCSLPSGVALNIKLFNLIQFSTTNTPDQTQMSARPENPPQAWFVPGVWILWNLETEAGTEMWIKAARS